jgi:hypothetical protein
MLRFVSLCSSNLLEIRILRPHILNRANTRPPSTGPIDPPLPGARGSKSKHFAENNPSQLLNSLTSYCFILPDQNISQKLHCKLRVSDSPDLAIPGCVLWFNFSLLKR